MLLITAKAQGLIAEFDGFTLCGGSVRLQEVQAEQTLMKPGNLCKQDSCDDKCSLVGEVLLVSYKGGL